MREGEFLECQRNRRESIMRCSLDEFVRAADKMRAIFPIIWCINSSFAKIEESRLDSHLVRPTMIGGSRVKAGDPRNIAKHPVVVAVNLVVQR